MRFSSFVLKNVFRRRARSLLTMTGMAVAVAAVVALVGVSRGIEHSLLESYQRRGVALIVSNSNHVSPLSASMDQKVGDEIAKLDGVTGVCPGLVDVLSFDNLGSQAIVVQGWPAWAYMFGELKVLRGECLTEANSGKKAIMLGKDLAENSKLNVGDKVSMSDEDYHVLGVYEAVTDFENSMAILLLEDAQKLSGKKGQITGCTVRVKDFTPEGVEKVRLAIEGAVAEKCGLKGKIRAKPPADFLKSNTQIRAAKAGAWAVGGIALVIGFFFMLNTMVMSVFERTREIGILRAIGWRPWRVMRMILMESVLLSVGGAIVGTALGIGGIWGLSRLPAVNGAVQFGVSPEIVGQAFLIALLVGVIGAAYPAYRGAKLLPTEALRHE
jgi:putative ABC transport system permease protein